DHRRGRRAAPPGTAGRRGDRQRDPAGPARRGPGHPGRAAARPGRRRPARRPGGGHRPARRGPPAPDPPRDGDPPARRGRRAAPAGPYAAVPPRRHRPVGPVRPGRGPLMTSTPAARRELDVDAILADPTIRIVVSCGAGGVGKTTTAAALALRAAEAHDRHTVVLTIDPARRLAQALGLTELDNTPRTVAKANGRLDAMMLDMKRTFDEVVLAHTDPKK